MWLEEATLMMMMMMVNKDGKPYDAPPTGPFDGAALATAEKDCLVESQNWPRSS